MKLKDYLTDAENMFSDTWIGIIAGVISAAVLGSFCWFVGWLVTTFTPAAAIIFVGKAFAILMIAIIGGRIAYLVITFLIGGISLLIKKFKS